MAKKWFLLPAGLLVLNVATFAWNYNLDQGTVWRYPPLVMGGICLASFGWMIAYSRLERKALQEKSYLEDLLRDRQKHYDSLQRELDTLVYVGEEEGAVRVTDGAFALFSGGKWRHVSREEFRKIVGAVIQALNSSVTLADTCPECERAVEIPQNDYICTDCRKADVNGN